MLLIFYNKDMDVCIFEYCMINGVLSLEKKEIVYNNDTHAKLFKDKIGDVSDYIHRVLLDNQDRFKDKRVIIFDSDAESSLYDRSELMDMLFLYRREITIVKAEISEEDAEAVASWLCSHSSI